MDPTRDQPSLDPLYLGQRAWTQPAAWSWIPRSRPAADDAGARNPWGAAQLAALLAALAPVARVRELRFRTPPELTAVVVGRYAWAADEPHARFERAVVELVRTAVLPIAIVELALDVRVWLDRGPAPARAWIGPGLWAALQVEASAPTGGLTVHQPAVFAGPANAPLLADALAAVGSALGPVTPQAADAT